MAVWADSIFAGQFWCLVELLSRVNRTASNFVLELTRVPLPRDWFVNEDLIYRINDEGSEYELIILSDPFDKFHNESGEKWRSDIDSYLPPKREDMFDDFPINRYIKRAESD